MNNEIYNKQIYKLLDICKTNDNGNIIISGLSIKMALTMLLNGAEGKSKEQLLSFLGNTKEYLNNDTYQRLMECGENLKLANSYWISSPNNINPVYQKIIKTYQNAEIFIEDFYSPIAKEKINNWVKNGTNGLIDKIVENTSELTSILINTLFFKAQWSKPFSEQLTYDSVFYGTVKTSNVKMMKNSLNNYFENQSAVGCSLNYENSPYEFIAVLPKNDGAFNIQNLDLNTLTQINGNYQVNIDFPKLNIEYENELKEALKSIGINAPFINPKDFVSMMHIPQIVDKVIHKTNFKLDEKGTEASAATAIAMTRGAAFDITPKTKINLTFNRPFAFMIRHKETKELLFIGKINNL